MGCCRDIGSFTVSSFLESCRANLRAKANGLVFLIAVSLLISSAPSRAQTTPKEPPSGQSIPSQSAQIQPNLPATVLLKKVVVFLSVDYIDQGQVGQLRGTAFFVAYEDSRLGPNRGFIYLVTNRHMADPQKDGRKFSITRISVRLNLKSGIAPKESEDLTLSIGGSLPWIFPQDDAVDLAILPFAPDQNRYDYGPLPTSMFATKSVIESRQIAEGDPVDFAGFFYQFPGQTKMEPIVRQGILAMMPDEKLQTTLGKLGHLYLADVHVFHGNSGSPMFVNVGGLHGGSLILGGFPYLLLGVVSGYFYETEDLQLQVASTLSGTANANSGISIVVPVYELKTLLDSAEPQRLRDAEAARVPNAHH
jgi:hypothetical protein